MSDTTPAEITGTTPAGKAARTITVTPMDDGRVRVAILSAQGNLLGDVWLDRPRSRQAASTLNNAATVASLRQQGGKG